MINELDTATRIVNRLVDYTNKKMFEPIDITLYLNGGTDEYRSHIGEMRGVVTSLLSTLTPEEETPGAFALISKMLQKEIVDMIGIGMTYVITNKYLSTVSFNKAALLVHIQDFFNTCIVGVYVNSKGEDK